MNALLTVDRLVVGVAIVTYHWHHSWSQTWENSIHQNILDSDSGFDDLSEMIDCDLGGAAVVVIGAADYDEHLGVSGAHHLDDAGGNRA